jgi:two-component system probable response regulator PhcQ
MLKRGLELFALQRERDQLLKQKMAVLHNTMVADRIVSLGLMAAGLSHHIRNALVAVKTFLDLAPAKMQEEKRAGMTLKNPEFWNDYYENVQGQIQKINHLLRELGSASEDHSREFPDHVHLHEVLVQVLAGLDAQLKGCDIRVENHVPDTLPVLKVDKTRFIRLWELLLRDELVSLHPGSTIRISATSSTDSTPANPQIEIRVEDDGPGMPQESRRLLFDPFVVRSESPMEYGINLMACYFIVHHHGGTIHANESQRKGTTFIITLPTDPARAPIAQEDPELFQKVWANESAWHKLATG